MTEEELTFPCSDSPTSVTTVARKSASPGRGAPYPCPWAPVPREGLIAILEGCDTSQPSPAHKSGNIFREQESCKS